MAASPAEDEAVEFSGLSWKVKYTASDSAWLVEMNLNNGAGACYVGSRSVEFDRVAVSMDAEGEVGSVRADVSVNSRAPETGFSGLWIDGNFGGDNSVSEHGLQTLELRGAGHRWFTDKGKGKGRVPAADTDRSRSPARSAGADGPRRRPA
jgi:hypothetical protein